MRHASVLALLRRSVLANPRATGLLAGKQGKFMNVINSQAKSDCIEGSDAPSESAVSKMTAEILPACFLLGIISGFTAFVAFGQAILPGLIAAVLGAFFGLFFACEDSSTAGK
jgi:hypothetical protein